jgi:glucose/arabinose dehydrogenase
METMRRPQTQTENPAWHGWLPLQPCRRTAFHRIVRYALPAGVIAPTVAPEVIVSGLPLTGDHPMHPFAIDARGGLYVNLGSATNACQVQNRMPNSPGIQACTELETRAGIWRYDANRTGQRFSPAKRFATGIRNAGGIAVDFTGLGIYATQHGRDQLGEN